MAGLGHQRGGLAGTRMTQAKLDWSDLRCLFTAPRGGAGGREKKNPPERTNKKSIENLLLIFKRTVELAGFKCEKFFFYKQTIFAF